MNLTPIQRVEVVLSAMAHELVWGLDQCAEKQQCKTLEGRCPVSTRECGCGVWARSTHVERLGSVILREMGSFGVQGEHGEFKI